MKPKGGLNHPTISTKIFFYTREVQLLDHILIWCPVKSQMLISFTTDSIFQYGRAKYIVQVISERYLREWNKKAAEQLIEKLESAIEEIKGKDLKTFPK